MTRWALALVGCPDCHGMYLEGRGMTLHRRKCAARALRSLFGYLAERTSAPEPVR